MTYRLGILGFGEAGSGLAQASGWAGSAIAYDIRLEDAGDTAMTAALFSTGVATARSASELAMAPAIVSLVTADQCLAAAQAMAPHIRPGTFYFDGNSVAPQTKRRAAEAIEAAGGHYVDAAIMAPVHPLLLDVPLLLSGPTGGEALVILTDLGFSNLRFVGDAVGRAATIKMLRSVIYKGMEALTAECVLACDRAGVLDEVLGSLGGEWRALADYRLDRMMVHGTRRAAEMREAVATLEQLGIDPLMTRGTIAVQAALGAHRLDRIPDGLDAKLEGLRAA